MVEQELAKLGLVLPNPPKAIATYKQFLMTGNFVYVSGQLPLLDGVLQYKGTVGKDLSVPQGGDAARLCSLNILSIIRLAVDGDWSKIKSLIRINGFVNTESSFEHHSKVINCASELLLGVLGEEVGGHTRTSIGVSSLPLGAAVEIDAIFELT